MLLLLIAPRAAGRAQEWLRKENVEVAVKYRKPRAGAAETGTCEMSMISEVELMCQLDHENIVRCYGYCDAPPHGLRIVMKYMDGG